MGIQEAIEQSREKQTIFIVKEALFCSVYEESAWRFTEFIKPYKPTKKRVKKLNMDVVSIGFPKTQLPAIMEISTRQGFTVVREESGLLVIQTLEEPGLDFSAWKAGTPVNLVEHHLKNLQQEYEMPDDLYSIVKDVESFTVADHTPMQSMQFLIDLQNKIKLVKRTPE